ncbi:MAG: nuclear transport factor 2 family protein [Merismopedia sp. SIO2A8]|nr:nuclear transport factor 2 family protein [Merismopedia sp. SIO2A8]
MHPGGGRENLGRSLGYTNHLGQVLTKQDDIIAHQSGTVKLEVLTPSEQYIQISGDIAVVSVRMHILGSYAGNKSDGNFRFTRIWARSSGSSWHVLAAHSSVVT